MEEQEDVNTTRFTFALMQEFSTFWVPFIHGSIKVAYNIFQIATNYHMYIDYVMLLKR